MGRRPRSKGHPHRRAHHYDDLTFGHLPWAENLPTALRGLKHGLAALDPADRSRVGAAIYADWTSSPEEWEEYLALWIGFAAGMPAVRARCF